MAITEFLLARIAEDEQVARDYERVWDGYDGRTDPDRVYAECEAKRRVVALAEDAEDLDNTVWADRGLSSDPGYNDPRCGERILRALALPYADHPDYDPEWKP